MVADWYLRCDVVRHGDRARAHGPHKRRRARTLLARGCGGDRHHLPGFAALDQPSGALALQFSRQDNGPDGSTASGRYGPDQRREVCGLEARNCRLARGGGPLSGVQPGALPRRQVHRRRPGQGPSPERIRAYAGTIPRAAPSAASGPKASAHCYGRRLADAGGSPRGVSQPEPEGPSPLRRL